MSLTLAAWSGFLIPSLIVLFLFVCVVLILTILIQRPQGGGLSGAFGSGAGSGQTAFGAKTGDVLTIWTIAVFVIYLGVAAGLNLAVKPPQAQTVADDAQPMTTTPASGTDTTPPTSSDDAQDDAVASDGAGDAATNPADASAPQGDAAPAPVTSEQQAPGADEPTSTKPDTGSTPQQGDGG